ncbi:cold-shock protein [Haloferax sp. Atlit-12N]|uniref:cold-shock protein n=1 Tax=Haloferax sp. Atlit-12N TaxID=2077203 RepID=UPI000E278324|nr:cold shock domain-containing protein [Haloferax sp. Atlit-12N]RDZ64038.1 cold-shock protein [Haloferax sp. Atlit-12N]
MSQFQFEGVVDFFNDTGGYGWISNEVLDEDVFFHMQDIGGPDLAEGQQVSFEYEESEKGPRVTNIERLSNPDDLDAEGDER